MTNHEGKLGGLLAANVTLDGFRAVFTKIEPMLGSALTLVQIAVGIASAYYFFHKAREAKSNTKTEKPKRKCKK